MTRLRKTKQFDSNKKELSKKNLKFVSIEFSFNFNFVVVDVKFNSDKKYKRCHSILFIFDFKASYCCIVLFSI